jgi:cation-transporting ATPase 13A1
MYYGLVMVSGVAFSCATEFIPALNEKLKLVPFTQDFKYMITGVMILDFGACWAIEKGLKWGFRDNKPKDIALRRPDQLEKEYARKAEEERVVMEKRAAEKEEQRRILEERIAEKKRAWGLTP